jgi:hypothetical protein
MPSVGGSKMLSIAIECCLTGKMPLSKAWEMIFLGVIDHQLLPIRNKRTICFFVSCYHLSCNALKAIQNPTHRRNAESPSSKLLDCNASNNRKVKHNDFSNVNEKFEEEHTAQEVCTLCNKHGILKET